MRWIDLCRQHGYDKEVVASPKKAKITKQVAQFSNIGGDNITDIILQTPYMDIGNLCSSSRIFSLKCQDNKTWQLLIARDFPYFPDDLPDSKKEYQSLYKFYDTYTTKVFKEFIEFKEGLINFQDAYNEIFKLLTNYFSEYFDIDLEEDEKNNYRLQHELELKTFLEIFRVLHVPIKTKISANQINPPSHNDKRTDLDKIRYLNLIFSHMFLIQSAINSDF
jgi:hypothetical protein